MALSDSRPDITAKLLSPNLSAVPDEPQAFTPCRSTLAKRVTTTGSLLILPPPNQRGPVPPLQPIAEGHVIRRFTGFRMYVGILADLLGEFHKIGGYLNQLKDPSGQEKLVQALCGLYPRSHC